MALMNLPNLSVLVYVRVVGMALMNLPQSIRLSLC